MAFADTNRVGLRYSFETVWGETPTTPTMTDLRHTGESLAYSKNTTISNEIRADRQVPDVIEAGVSTEGGFNFEFSYGAYDDFIQACLCSSGWTTISLTGLSLTVAAVAKTITRSTGSWVTDGVTVGMYVKFGGFTNLPNNQAFRVNTVTATVLTVDDISTALVNEGPTAACTAKVKTIRNPNTGLVNKSFLIEKTFSDIGKFIWMNGMRVNTFALSVNSGNPVTGSIGFIGKSTNVANATQSGSITAATTADVFNASANIGGVAKNYAALTTGIKRIDLNLNNNLRRQDIIGSKFAGGVGYGRLEITGTLEAYFEDSLLMTDLINHSSVSLSFRMTNLAGNVVIVTLPAVRFTRGNPNASGGNADVMIPLEFAAIRDTTLNYMIQFDSIQ